MMSSGSIFMWMTTLSTSFEAEERSLFIPFDLCSHPRIADVLAASARSSSVRLTINSPAPIQTACADRAGRRGIGCSDCFAVLLRAPEQYIVVSLLPLE